MNIDLDKKISDHFTRLESLAREAEADEEESYSSRASAMSALTGMLKELTKTQESVINMKRLMAIEKVTIELVKKSLSAEQVEEFLNSLEESLT